MFGNQVLLVFFQGHFSLNKQLMIGQGIGIGCHALFLIKAFGLRTTFEHFLGGNAAFPLHGLFSPLIRMHGLNDMLVHQLFQLLNRFIYQCGQLRQDRDHLRQRHAFQHPALLH